MIGDAFRAGRGVFEHLLAAKEEWSARLLQHQLDPSLERAASAVAHRIDDNIIGVGIGEKVVRGISLGLPALKVYVREKRPLKGSSEINLLPKAIKGLLVDVEEIGDVRSLSSHEPDPRQRARPAHPGCSIGIELAHGRPPMAGTFGALVTKDRDFFLLSNNHVLSNEGRLPIGTPIFQPALLDAPAGRRSPIAKLTRPIDLRLGYMNRIDVAIARVDKPASVSREILSIGAPRGTAKATHDMVVHKFGRTTRYRAGRITSVNTDVKIRYETGDYLFEGQVIIQGLNGQSFSEVGDSGALVLDRTSGAAIGQLCGGSRSHSIANHIKEVLGPLGVTLA